MIATGLQMTEPNSRLLHAGRTAAAKLADRRTPLVLEEWYVAALSDEIGRTLLRRRLLSEAMLLFRKLDGQAVAMSDRCIHRSFPLSSGTLDGDTVICGYHGFRYDCDGDVVEVPAQPSCPAGLGVRSYPLFEQGNVVWIWMGRGEPSAPPTLDWLDHPGWTSSHGVFDLKASYIALHENLMDLSHLSFIHAESFGSPDYARTPIEIEDEGGVIAVTRHVFPTTLPQVWAEATGIGTSPTASRLTRSEFYGPALQVVHGTFRETTGEDNRAFRIRTCHVITPQDARSTHYFIIQSRDFALDDEAVTAITHDRLWSVFAEDVVALELIEATIEEDEVPLELSIGTDRPGVLVRRRILERTNQERSRAVASPVALPATT